MLLGCMVCRTEMMCLIAYLNDTACMCITTQYDSFGPQAVSSCELYNLFTNHHELSRYVSKQTVHMTWKTFNAY